MAGLGATACAASGGCWREVVVVKMCTIFDAEATFLGIVAAVENDIIAAVADMDTSYTDAMVIDSCQIICAIHIDSYRCRYLHSDVIIVYYGAPLDH